MSEVHAPTSESAAAPPDPAALRASVESLRQLLSEAQPGLILLFNPPQLPTESVQAETGRNRGYSTYPPSGLYHLAAALHAKDPAMDVRIYDLHLRMIQLATEGETDLRGALRREVQAICAGHSVA